MSTSQASCGGLCEDSDKHKSQQPGGGGLASPVPSLWCPLEPGHVGEQILFACVGRILRNSQAEGNFPNLLLVGSGLMEETLENQKF